MSNGVSKIVSDFLSGSSISSGGPVSDGVVSEDQIVRADDTSDAQEDYGTEAKSSESTLEDLLPGSEDTQKDSQDKSEAKAQGKPETSTKEVITVTDADGKKKKVEIDYSNKESIKKAHLLANGARKWQADRDKAIQSEAAVKQELSQIKSDWSKLDEAYQKGPEHLFDLLQGPGAFDKLIQARIERKEFLKNASPEEIRALQAQDQAEQKARELDKINKKYEDLEKRVMAEKEQAEERALESRVHPVFNKYRFADTLGNADDEHIFDKMLWTTALERLEPYEQKGVDITPELVDREFKAVAQSIRNRINVQAEKKATKNVEQKKKEATENVQAKVMSGYKTGGTAQEARDLLKKSDLTSLLKGWNKYGSVFNSGKK